MLLTLRQSGFAPNLKHLVYLDRVLVIQSDNLSPGDYIYTTCPHEQYATLGQFLAEVNRSEFRFFFT